MTIDSIETLYHLPRRLKERTKLVKGGKPKARPFLLYWMHRAMRHHENPALDVAIELGNRLSLPVLVLIDLQPNGIQNTARHLKFMLEGAKTVRSHLENIGIGCAINVQREGYPQQALLRTALQSAALICEDWPIKAHRKQIESLTNRLDVPIFTVDAATILPMSKSHQTPKEALGFKLDFEQERERIIVEEGLPATPEKSQLIFDLPFENINEIDVNALIDASSVDHSIPPLLTPRGGSDEALSIWNAFRRTNIKEYHLNRGAPLKKGTSRLSPYLHYGMISPLKVAREAACIPGPGAEDFLRGLSIWRDLAFHWCARHLSPQFNTLPGWAQTSLNAQRTALRPMETEVAALFRAKGPDPLWNACQRSLLHYGWLHPALRKTWAKMFLQFIPDPKEALNLALQFNNRLALDGGGPCSILGTLHCFGLFDRPATDSQPIFGRVSKRSSAHHVGRINLPKYEASLNVAKKRQKMAIIGGGPAGLICGRTLDDYGHDVRLFESQVSPGQRARSFVDPDHRDFLFDVGYLNIQIQDPRFERIIQPLIDSRLIRQWAPRTAVLNDQMLPIDSPAVKRWTPCPRMATLIQRIKAPLELRCNHHINNLRLAAKGWYVTANDRESGPYDELIVATDAKTTHSLLPEHLKSSLFFNEQEACQSALSLFVQFEENPKCHWDLIIMDHPLVARICREDSKPMRPESKIWRIDINENHRYHQHELDSKQIRTAIVSALEPFFRAKLSIHRSKVVYWPAAIRTSNKKGSVHRNKAMRLTLTTDTLFGSDFESAYLSGVAAAGRVLRCD